jgi:hypothetical protein
MRVEREKRSGSYSHGWTFLRETSGGGEIEFTREKRYFLFGFIGLFKLWL